MVFFHHHILTLVLFTPLAGAIPLVFIPATRLRLIRGWAHLVMFGDLLLSLPLIFWLVREASGQQFSLLEDHIWIRALGVHYLLGLDGVSLLLVVLTTFLGFLATFAWRPAAENGVRQYYIVSLVLQTALLGSLMALDLFLLYVFWEATLVPLYFLIAVWGGPRRLYVAMKFLLYNLAGSLVMLLGILALTVRYHVDTGSYTFSVIDLARHASAWPAHLQVWVFWVLMAAFAIRVPMVPFHTWLPDVLVEAPLGVSAMVAGVFLNTGVYGFLRLALPLLPKASSSSTVVEIMVVLSIVAILYGALLTLMQRDAKTLVACSCLSSMGFCTLGIFALNSHGISGSVMQLLSHGLSIVALFLIVGVIYDRRQTLEIKELGGLAKAMPVFATLAAIIVLGSIGMPLLSGFVAEFAILQGLFEANAYWAAWAAAGVVLTAAYLLWFYQRTMLASGEGLAGQAPADLRRRETVTLLPLAIVVLWIGIYPRPFLRVLEEPVSAIIPRYAGSSCAAFSENGVPQGLAGKARVCAAPRVKAKAP